MVTAGPVDTDGWVCWFCVKPIVLDAESWGINGWGYLFHYRCRDAAGFDAFRLPARKSRRLWGRLARLGK